MQRTLALVLALSCSPAARAPEPPAAGPTGQPVPAQFDHDHAAWTALLEKYVRADGFDYAGLKAEREGLNRYLAQLRTVDPRMLASWTEDQRFAFWVNVYNAYTVDLVLDHYPVGSIRDIGSLLNRVWDEEFIPLRGLRPDGKEGDLSLNHVEHGILRKRFEDARVHAAVNCASESCPPLRAEAYTAANLDEQLDEQARAWLADPARNRFHPEERVLEVSQIFDWFAEDFERDAGSVQAWIARHAPPRHAEWIRAGEPPELDHLEYSWRLNDASRP